MIRCYWAIALLSLAPLLHAQEGTPGFYLLRTGSLLEGSATQDGRHYIVQTQFGTMNVPVQSVEFVGKSKIDIYQYKRNSVDPTNYSDLVRLAEWCVSNGYIAEGIAEYQRAGQAAPNAIFAGIVQQRLEALRRMGAAASAQELPTPQADIPAEKPAEFLVSRAAFESFVRQVQPLLVNRCVSTDCHGIHSEQQFKLGVPQERMGNTARRNLQAVLPYIDRNDPRESLILLALTTPHGGAKATVSVESNLYVQAAQWVQQVSKELPPEQRSESTSDLPEPFRHTIPQAEHSESGGKTQQRGADPLDPAVFNERYHRRVR